jgi:uracil-DNA glycosylase family 4
MTHAERQAALEAIATEVRACTNCRLAAGRTNAVPGEGSPDTEVVFVGEGPGFNEDKQGRPFVGRAGGVLMEFLRSVEWRRDDVFITNVVKCRPPENRDPEPDEIAACAPYLRRQLEILDPALVVTLGRFSLGTFMPSTRISQVHGTVRPADPATGAADATVLALYHPAAADRSPDVKRQSFEDIGAAPRALLDARERRAIARGGAPASDRDGAPDHAVADAETREAVAVLAVATPGTADPADASLAEALPASDLTIF